MYGKFLALGMKITTRNVYSPRSRCYAKKRGSPFEKTAGARTPTALRDHRSMSQKSLSDYQSDDQHRCPSCEYTSTARVGLSAHHRNVHDSKLAVVEIQDEFGVPADWLLRTTHHVLGMTVREMAKKLPCSRQSVNTMMDDVFDIHRRSIAEAQQKRMDEMTEEEQQQQVAAAHKKTRQLAENGEHQFQKWRRENPEAAKKQATEAAALGADGREENGMAGVTGQDHPRWHGGKSIYDAVKKQLHGPSWDTDRDEYRSDECRVCGGGENLHLHHIIPILAGGANGEWNYMTLCDSCHKTVEWRTWEFVSPVLVDD